MDIKKYFEKNLARHEKAKLGFLERLRLRSRGSLDGRAGLPRQDEAGQWTSPFIQQELNACSEAHNKVVGTLSLRLDEEYTAAVYLAERIERALARIAEIEGSLPEPPGAEALNVRKRGEEALSESQVRHRRRREFEREKNRLSSQIHSLQAQADEDYDQLIRLKSDLDQKQSEAEIVCAKILCHVQQRVDCYWDAALHAAEAGDAMPVIFAGLVPSEVLAQYRKLHERDDQRIQSLIAVRAKRKEAA